MMKGRGVSAFLKALPLTAMLAVSWSMGELIGYLTARVSSFGVSTTAAIARSRHD